MEQNPMYFLYNMEKAMMKRRFKFAIKCLHELMQIEPNENIVFGSYNFYEGLFFIYLLVTGEIEKNLKYVLDLSDSNKNDLLRYRFVKTNSSDYATSYNDESTCWFREDLHSCFAPLFPLFNKFRHFVKLDVNTEDIEFILINVLRLDVKKLQITASKSDASKVSIPDIQKRKSFLCRELNMFIIEYLCENGVSLFILLPVSLIYGDGSFKMDVNRTGLCDLIKRLLTDDGINKLRDLLDNGTILESPINFPFRPIFKVEKNLNIWDLLHVLDIEQLLLADAIDFKYSYKDYNFEYSMNLNNVIHRTNVTVNKENILASSYNIICTGKTDESSLKKDKEIEELNYNYPFVWLIYEKQYRGILFVGTFNEFADNESQP